MKRAFRRMSPAMVVAIVALIAALGGSAIAGGVINKKKAKNIANNVVTQRAPGLSVLHAKTADNATSANSANSANQVGPLSANKFDYRATSGAARTTIGTFGNLVLTGSCETGPLTHLEASSTSNASEFKSEGVTEGQVAINRSNDTLNPGSVVTLNSNPAAPPPSTVEASGTFDFQSVSGSIATGTWGTEDNQTNFADCNAWGTVFNS